MVRLDAAFRVEFMFMGVRFVFRWVWSISVGRVLFPWVLWSMLSGPRHLLSALALGMSVGPVVVDPPVLSFLCLFCLPLGFGFVVSLGLFRPVGSAGVVRRRW